MPGFPFLTADHLEAFRDSLTWSDNPFVRRDARRDRKRQQPWRSFLWMCGTLLVLCGGGLALLNQLQTQGYANAWFLGDDIGTALCVLISGIHIYFVVGAAQKHTGRMLQEEISRSTLSSLLLLPSTPFQLILQSLVYPWLVGMRAAVVLLPLYAVCVGMGGVSWTDILLLYLVFAFSAVAVPRWNRPVLSDTVLISTPTAEPVNARNGANRNRNQGRSTGFGHWLSMSCFVLFGVLLSNRFSISYTYAWFGAYIPKSIWTLIPLSFFSWPLMVARGLVTPFNWFGYAVAPLPFVLILFCLSRYVQIVRVSEWLKVGLYRDLAALPSYLPRRRLESALLIGQIFVWTGYLWRWAIVEGGITGMAGWAGPTNAPGLPGFAYSLLFITIVTGGLARAGALADWCHATPASRRVRAYPQTRWRTAIPYLTSPFIFTVLFYLGCCLVARTAPFPHGVLLLGGRMLAVGAAGMLLRFGVGYYSKLLVYVGMTIPFAMACLPWVPNVAPGLVIPPSVKLLTYFSPTMGLVDLGNHRIGLDFFRYALRSAHSWQNWVRYSGITGLALTLSAGMWELIRSLWARRRAARKAGRSADVAMEVALGEKEPLYIDAVPERVALDPTLVGREAFMDAPMAKNAKDAQMESPVVLGLIVALQRVYDNAVATKEIRARLRGKVQPQTILRTFVIFLAVTCALLFVWPQIATAFGAYMAGSLFPNSPTEPALVYASVLSLWYLALCGLSPFVGGSLLAGAFAAEYEKSTLGFTLTTPMRASDIAGGKAIGLLIVGGINQAYIALWTLLLSIGFSVQLGLGRSLLIWVQMTGIAALVTITVGLIGLAIASLFPKQITVKSGGVVQALMVYGVIFAPGLLGVMWTAFVRWIGLPPVTVVLLIVAALVLLAILGMVVAIYGVSRMRLSDVVYSPTRRSS